MIVEDALRLRTRAAEALAEACVTIIATLDAAGAPRPPRRPRRGRLDRGFN
jgi:hypothetical protein